MTTELLDEKELTEEVEASAEVEEAPADLSGELEKLLLFKREHVPKEGQTPCPACTTLVQVTANECPHCSSYIAPNNALVREALRRIDEIEGQLNADHAALDEAQWQSANRSFWDRIRGMFSSTPAEPEVPATPLIEEGAPRFLDRVREGDQLIVLARLGSWYHVKTRDSKTGWVYSTMLEDQ